MQAKKLRVGFLDGLPAKGWQRSHIAPPHVPSTAGEPDEQTGALVERGTLKQQRLSEWQHVAVHLAARQTSNRVRLSRRFVKDSLT